MAHVQQYHSGDAQQSNIGVFTNGLTMEIANSNDTEGSILDACSTASQGFACFECYEMIEEQYFVMMDDKAWHTNCLLCDICRKGLGHQFSCYIKNSVIFCKDCYTRSALQRCKLCQSEILRTEFVFKCDQAYFHRSCFICNVCRRQLKKGEKFGQIYGVPYCEEHYLEAMITNIESQYSNILISIRHVLRSLHSESYAKPTVHALVDDQFKQSTSLSRRDAPLQMHMDNMSQDCYSYEMSSLDFMLSCTPSTPLNITDQFINNTTASSAFHHYHHHHHHHQQEATRAHALFLHDGKSIFKKKRARTSFRQEQLKELRNAFLLNQCPNTSELQHMSQQTGLSKRVLQVWFQNARAKQRRDRNSERKNQKKTARKDKQRK
eukprot:gene15811-17406_t